MAYARFATRLARAAVEIAHAAECLDRGGVGPVVVPFAAPHTGGPGALTRPVLTPYLAMCAVLVFVYVWTGKNVMFSYFVHASKNLLAVIFIYAIPPDLMEQLQKVQG